jgi:hypothetical protein
MRLVREERQGEIGMTKKDGTNGKRHHSYLVTEAGLFENGETIGEVRSLPVKPKRKNAGPVGPLEHCDRTVLLYTIGMRMAQRFNNCSELVSLGDRCERGCGEVRDKAVWQQRVGS